MASTVLYPPVLDSSSPAFIASGDGSQCRLFFSLSKYSTSAAPIKGVHVSIIKQNSGRSVINKVDDPLTKRYRSTGILIVNSPPVKVTDIDNLYYIDILNSDVKAGEDIGWKIGWIYKIQIRLSSVEYDGSIGQTAWLNSNASNFSEWSTYCTTKAIGLPRIQIPIMNNFDTLKENKKTNEEKYHTLSLSTLNFTGSYFNSDRSETLYSYRLELLDDSDNRKIEDSDIIYTNQYYSPNEFKYLFKSELYDNKKYQVRFSYTTINKYSDIITFKIEVARPDYPDYYFSIECLETIESVYDEHFIEDFKSIASYEKEEDDGLISLKLCDSDNRSFSGNLCIRRSSEKDDFSTWEDIKIIACKEENINELSIIQDKTIESGVRYKYALQGIDINGDRSRIISETPKIVREFNYAYLLGEGGRQLRLCYNNEMNSYTYNYSESKTDTIGGKYPFISRNGNMKYRTFPVTGLISFNMDENNLFINSQVTNTNKRLEKRHLPWYDYKREFDFREEVLKFLQDGKPKLFKSSTEGNIIVRLMDVTCQPNQTLNRMIYSFTSNALEVADSTMDNYRKYHFYEVGDYSTSFQKTELRIGQLDLDFDVGTDIIKEIWKKYNKSEQNIAGKRISLSKIGYLTLEFADKPLRIKNNAGDVTVGNNFLYNGNLFTVRGYGTRIYKFDEHIFLNQSDSIIVLGGIQDIYDENEEVYNKVHVTVDFLYEVTIEPYIDKQVESKTTEKGLGQLFSYYKGGSNLYNEIYYKYYYEWLREFRRLRNVTWVCIEAKPGAVFCLKDERDRSLATNKENRIHEMNWTGVLNLDGLGNIEDIEYMGMRQPDGSIDPSQGCDIIVDYIYYLNKGIYKREG